MYLTIKSILQVYNRLCIFPPMIERQSKLEHSLDSSNTHTHTSSGILIVFYLPAETGIWKEAFSLGIWLKKSDGDTEGVLVLGASSPAKFSSDLWRRNKCFALDMRGQLGGDLRQSS